MMSFFALVSVVGIIYMTLLFVAADKGLIWVFVMSAILLLSLHIGLNIFKETVDGAYVINNSIPTWIFNPECLIVVPAIVMSMRLAIIVVKSLQTA